MKKLLLSLGFLFAGSPLWAFSTPSLTYQVAISSIQTTTLLVSTSPASGATQVDNVQLSGRVALEIQNVDTAANLWCVPGSSASLTVNTGVGRKIAPGNTWVVSISNTLLNNGFPQTSTAVKFWCLSDGVASSSATVSQAY